MEFEPKNDFEQELRDAFERRSAPPGLKRKVMERRSRQNTEKLHAHRLIWQRLAASVVLAAALGGAVSWHSAEQRRKGEEAKRQVLTALRITGHALKQMNQQLAARDRDVQ